MMLPEKQIGLLIINIFKPELKRAALLLLLRMLIKS